MNVEALPLEALEIAHKAVEAASDKLATDIVLLDVRGICSFADYFVICSGESSRQVRAIYQEIEHAMKNEGVLPHHHEGKLDSGWLLVDYADVIVHIFASAEREFYDLDELWSEAVQVVRIQ
ncbi:MAG: ribosome silencing factor [Dehalococcoidales bacterium]